MSDTRASRTFSGLVHFWPSEMYFSPVPLLFLLTVFFFLPSTASDNCLGKNPVFPFNSVCPSATGLVRSEGMRYKWRREHYPHILLLLPALRMPSVTCHDPSFLSGSARSSIQGKGEKSLGGATLVALGNLLVMWKHRGKPRKKNRSTKEKPAKNCYWIPSDLFTAYCSAYKYESKQISKPAFLGQFDISVVTKTLSLWCYNICMKSEELCQQTYLLSLLPKSSREFGHWWEDKRNRKTPPFYSKSLQYGSKH